MHRHSCHRHVATLGLLVAMFAGTSETAHASIRECGSYGYVRGAMRWTFAPFTGATPAANLTTREVGCRTARRFALRYRGTDTYYPTWRCREHNDYEFSDVRCTASHGRVIHWQAGS